jgi:hypothetical protein
MNAFLLNSAFSAALGGFRLFGATNQSFQAVAHLYVGGLIAWAVAKKDWRYGGLAAALSVLELFAFLHSKGVF